MNDQTLANVRLIRGKVLAVLVSNLYHHRLRYGSVAVLSLALSVASDAHAQTATTFEEAISPNYSYAQAVQQTSDGGYVVGAVFSDPPYVALVAKLDSSGSFQRQKQYRYPIGSSAVIALKQTSDGAYIWAGYIRTVSEVASTAKFSISVRARNAGSVTVSASSTHFILSAECR
jgi:hypothetical protein